MYTFDNVPPSKVVEFQIEWLNKKLGNKFSNSDLDFANEEFEDLINAQYERLAKQSGNDKYELETLSADCYWNYRVYGDW